MRTIAACCVLLAWLPGILIAGNEDRAREMVARLMLMPSAAEDPHGIRNQERWKLIRDIGALGDAAIPALEAGRKDATTGLQRMELTQALADVRTPAGTTALLALTTDTDDDVRGAAIIGLADRVESPPREGGDARILTDLAKLAAGEKIEINRKYICLAMRSALKPLPPAVQVDEERKKIAVAMLRDRLANDSADEIRFCAASVLTEFGDFSGREELKKTALRMQATSDDGTLWGLEQLAKAVERVSGKSFGPVPMNPMLSSSINRIPGLKAGRLAVLAKIVEWVNSDPATQPAGG